MLKHISKYLIRLIYIFIIIFLVLIIGVLFFSTFEFPGNVKFYSVQSGSMEPSISLGSIVIVRSEDSYGVGDVITVLETDNSEITVTHRIVEVKDIEEEKIYITKGDANEGTDLDERMGPQVLGKVILAIPLLGYVVTFAKTGQGLLILVIIPAIVIIYSEALNIKKEVKRMIKERKDNNLKEQV